MESYETKLTFIHIGFTVKVIILFLIHIWILECKNYGYLMIILNILKTYHFKNWNEITKGVNKR